MASLMITTMRRSGGIFSSTAISEKELEAIAKVVHGHALGACRAISYILHVTAQTTDESPAGVFLDMFDGTDWESRLRFLEYKPRIGLSIIETFAISLGRMRRHQAEAARLLELLAFLSGRDQSLNFRIFLRLERPWLKELRPILPDYEVFANRLTAKREYLAELENVSIGVRPDVSTPLQIHPLWLECIQQRAGHEGRVRWIRQIINICHISYTRGEEENFISLRPFLENALAIAARFRIESDELLDSQELRDWMNSLKEEPEDPHNEPGSESSLSDESETADTMEDNTSKAVDVTEMSGKTLQLFQDMVNLRDSCNEAAQVLAQRNVSKMSEESFASCRLRYFTLLRRLKSLEDDGQHLRIDVALHLQTYDLLLGMAPAFQHLNPRLCELLRERMEAIQQDHNRSLSGQGTVAAAP